MAISLLATVSDGNYTPADTGSYSLSHTVDSGTDMLIVCVFLGYPASRTISSVTFGGTGMTQVSGANVTDGSYARSAIYYLANPTETTANVTVTLGGGTGRPGLTAFNLSGVDTSDPFGTAVTNTGSGTSASLSVSSASGEFVIDALAVRDGGYGFGVGADQTVIDKSDPTDSNYAARCTSYEPGAASVTMSWSWTGSVSYSHASVPVQPATAAAVTVEPPAGSIAITGYAPTVTGGGLDAPSIVTVTVDGTTATLEWTPASTAGIRVWLRVHGVTEWTAPIAELTAGETTYDVEWLDPSTSYDFGVSHFTATDESDIAVTTTAIDAPVSVDVPIGVLALTGYAPIVTVGALLAPTGLTATVDDDGFDLAWTDTNGGAVAYLIEYRRTDVSGDYVFAAITDPGAESYDLEWLAQGIEYEIRVQSGTDPGSPTATATATTGTVAVVSGVFG